MNCQEVEQRDIVELYLLDRLTESERDEFERHYFECSSCFSQLQTGLTVEAELRRQPLAHSQAGGAMRRRMWTWTPAFVAAALLLAAGIWRYSTLQHQASPQVAISPGTTNPAARAPSPSPSTTAPSLEELARVEPPPYSSVVLRGADNDAQDAFRTAMQYYTKGDYAHAIPGLRAAIKTSPQTARFNFYLGACYLLTDQTDSAIASFGRTVTLGDPSYSEPAHFYLAKAYLRKKEIPAAEDELQKTVNLHGGMEAEARDILLQLRK